MPNRKAIPIYAGLKGDLLIPINDAQKGIRYKCLQCSEDIIVKGGLKRIKHFSHLPDSNCNGESILHLTAKRIIKDNNEIIIPPRGGNSFKYTKATEEYALKSENGTLRKVDILIENAEEKLAIEIKVTHAVEEGKILDFRRRKLKAIEIDLSEHHIKELKFETLCYYVLRDDKNRKLLIPIDNKFKHKHIIQEQRNVVKSSVQKSDKREITKKDNFELTPEDPIEEDFKPSYGGQDDSSITYTPPNGDRNW